MAAPLSRRQFLQRLALVGVGGPAAAQLLAACGSPTPEGSGPGTASPTLQIASPTNPVTWPISPGNEPIAAGLAPERGATLRLYTYADYLDPEAIKGFERRYASSGVKVNVSTFNDTEEAITKIRAGSVPFDLYFPSYDQIARLVVGGLVRPLQHAYVPGIRNVWPQFSDPWYDQEWRYTVPYTVYTTGIGWRTDEIREQIGDRADPYSALWDPTYSGQVAVIDDWATAMAMVLLELGIDDVNTSDPGQLQQLQQRLTQLQQATDPKVTITMYNDLPAGQLGLCQMWSGDVVNAQYYLPSGTPPTVLAYWFPEDGRGLVDNDLMVVLRQGQNPVLAHLFIEHMLDPQVARANFSAIGYQPPQVTLDPDDVVAEGFVPANLASAVVRPQDFERGYRLLEKPPAVAAQWQQIWARFKAGA